MGPRAGPDWYGKFFSPPVFDPRVTLVKFRKGRISEVWYSVCLFWDLISVKADVLPCVVIYQNDCLRTNTNYRMTREGITLKCKSTFVDLRCTFSFKCLNLIVFARHVRTWK